MLSFNVLYGSWTGAGTEFPAGENTVEHPSEELVLAAGAAHAAGVLDVTEGLVLDHVSTPEEDAEALATAMGNWVPEVQNDDGTSTPGHWDGPWREGHLFNVQADAEGMQALLAIDVAEVEA